MDRRTSIGCVWASVAMRGRLAASARSSARVSPSPPHRHPCVRGPRAVQIACDRQQLVHQLRRIRHGNAVLRHRGQDRALQITGRVALAIALLHAKAEDCSLSLLRRIGSFRSAAARPFAGRASQPPADAASAFTTWATLPALRASLGSTLVAASTACQHRSAEPQSPARHRR